MYGVKDKINIFIEKINLTLKRESQLSLLDAEDEYLMSAYINVFEPVAVALDRLQSEKNDGQGYILPTLFTMRYRIQNIPGGGNILKCFQDTMLEVCNKRFENFFKIDERNSEL